MVEVGVDRAATTSGPWDTVVIVIRRAVDGMVTTLANAFVDVRWPDVAQELEELRERAEQRRLADEERAALAFVPPPRRPAHEVRARTADRRAALAPPRRLWRPRRPT